MIKRAINFLKSRKFKLLMIDCVLLLMASFFAMIAANSLSYVSISLDSVIHEIIMFVFFNITFLALFGAYNIMWRYARLKELFECAVSMTVASAICYLVFLMLKIGVDSDIHYLLSYLFAVCALVGSRSAYYYFKNSVVNQPRMPKGENTLIIGAGDACNRLVSEMMLSKNCTYKPVAIVDDEESKRYRTICGVPVAGKTSDIPALCEKYDIKTILFAIPSCSGEDKARIMSICAETNCEVKKIPYLHEIIEVEDLLSQIKPIKIDDLLERDVIKIKNPKVAENIKDEICMVTGGGGSIGSELSRQIAKKSPKKLIIVDIYENNAYDIQQELIREYGDSLDLCVEIASVRDYDKMRVLFEKYNPKFVFHAAAHKHVPLMETNPEEAIKNNIFGTYNVASLADEFGVKKFVLVSTDKAVNPTNVMGATKRCCEMIVQYMAQKKSKTEFIAVRFGNVLGSNGSVIPLFERQIAEGQPVTVTHPEIIRYFMTIPEAVMLILEAATIARGGEIFVLDMGKPVKILTLAENLIRMHGKEPYTEVKIEFTGLRPGEKLYEELLMDEEGLRQTENDRIFVGQQIKVDSKDFEQKLQALKKASGDNDAKECVMKLCDTVPTFVRNNEKKTEAVG